MDDQTLVFDISSDEEFGFYDNPPADLDGFDWISKMLYDVTDVSADAIDQKISHNDKINDDDDDVIVVGEVIVKPRRAKRSFSMVTKDDDDDDDCMVLEGDPDKTSSSISNGEVKNCDDDDSDDLVVVGQKGQVACRDFPHSRHLCANFPFNSTSHESRCVQCHCYICDSLAPCAYWGSGASTTDHCHATDKEIYWRTERKKFRELKNPHLPVSKPIVSMPQFPQSMQAPPQRRLHPIVSRSTVSPSFGVPNIVSQSRIHRPSVTVARNGYHPHMMSRQISRACNSDNQGNRVALLASRMSPRPMFKRLRVPNRSYCSPNNVSVAFSQLVQQPAVNPMKNSSVELQGSYPGLVLNPSSRHSNSRMLPSHLPGYVFPRPHTPSSHYQGDVDVQYTNSSMHQGQSISSTPIPCSTTSTAFIRASENNQQHSVETQNGSVPNFLTPTNSEMPTDCIQSSYQASGLMQSCSINPCSTLNDSLLQDSLVEVKVAGMDGSLPSAEKDSKPAFDFDVDSWLENSQDGSFFDMSSQSSQTAPIDTGMLYFDFETSWQGLAHS